MPVQLNSGFVVGLAMFFVGAFLLMGVMGKNGGLAFGFQAWRNLARMLRDPGRKASRRLFWCGFVIVCVGGLVTCGSIMAGDAGRNRVCRQACKEAGFDRGRFRKSPHRQPGKEEPYRCWCRADKRWSKEPVQLP